MKKSGWTMAELTVSFIVIILLSGFAISLFKPGANKNKLFIYSALRSLEKANIAVLDEETGVGLGYSENEEQRLDKLSDGTTDWYCAHIADVLSLNSAPNCTRGLAGDTTINLKFSNGITVQGLATPWVEPYSGATYQFKNIVIDIDGPDNGPNKPWADRFPVRVYRGSGVTEGLIMPVNCASDQVYNESTSNMVPVQNTAKNPYCPASNAKNYAIDDEVITYDIYKIQSEDEASKAELIATGLSVFEALCAARGGVNGFYSQMECSNGGVKIHTKCATAENCEVCGNNSGNCPLDSNGTQTTPETCANMAAGFDCFTIIHKPSGGLPFFIQAIIGDISEEGI